MNRDRSAVVLVCAFGRILWSFTAEEWDLFFLLGFLSLDSCVGKEEEVDRCGNQMVFCSAI